MIFVFGERRIIRFCSFWIVAIISPSTAFLFLASYMLSEAQGMFLSAPWYAIGTGLTLVWMVFGVGLIGEGLQRQRGGGA